MPQVHLKVLQPRRPDEVDRQAHDLHVGPERAVTQQFGADLKRLPGPPAALGLLAVHLPRVAQTQRQLGAGERGGRDAGDAGGEVVAQGQDPPVPVGEAEQPLRDSSAAGPKKHVLVLECGREKLLVSAALEHRHRGALQLAAAAGGVAGEVEGPWRGGCGKVAASRSPRPRAPGARGRRAAAR